MKIGIEDCADHAAGKTVREFSATDRVAAGATRNLRPAPRQWLPDAAAAQVLRIFAMPLEDRELRTSGSAAPPPPGSVEMGSAAVAALPEDALILIPTPNLVLFPGTVLPITLARQRSLFA